jgi:DHA1 family multidrug resistance protein-like MFS transporter
MADNWGFRSAFYVTAVLLVAAGLLVTFGIEEVFTPKIRTKKSNLFMGDWQEILSASGVGLIYFVRGLSWLARTMLIPVIPLFAASLMAGADHVSTFTGLVIGVAAATGTASAVYLGKLGDRMGHRHILVGCAVVGALLYSAQIVVTQPWHLFTLQALAGAAIGGINPAVSALLNQFTQPGQEGAVYGLDSSVAAAARAVAPMVGTMLVVWVGFSGAFVASGLIYMFTALMAIWFLPNFKVAAQPQAL